MINQLAELHKLAPDVCYSPGLLPKFVIADYGFWQTEDGELIACPISSDYFEFSKNIGGRMALAFLCDALEQVIAARWDFEYRFFSSVGTTPDRHSVEILNGKGEHVGDTKAAALLSAFIAALKADQ